MKNSTKKLEKIIGVLIFSIIIAISLYLNINIENKIDNTISGAEISYELSNIPEYNGKIYITINNDIPKFTTEDMSIRTDYYSELRKRKSTVWR